MRARIGPLSGVSHEEGWATYAESKARRIAGDLNSPIPAANPSRRSADASAPSSRNSGRDIAGNDLVVAHGVVIRVMLTGLVAGFAPADFDRIAIDFASVNDLWYDGLSWTARRS